MTAALITFASATLMLAYSFYWRYRAKAAEQDVLDSAADLRELQATREYIEASNGRDVMVLRAALKQALADLRGCSDPAAVRERLQRLLSDTTSNAAAPVPGAGASGGGAGQPGDAS